MALINSKNKYIKLYENGAYEVYSSEEARKRFKESTSSAVILHKYQELIAELESPELAEFRYYASDEFAAKYNPLVREYERYSYNLTHYIVDQEYPIIAEYYPDVANSIPEILGTARIPQTNKDLKEAYMKAKQVKRFGETTDA